MNELPAKALTAVLAGTGAALGLVAAVVWHVAVPGGVRSGQVARSPVRPDWFPVSLVLIAAGVLAGLVVASCLFDVGVRVERDRTRPWVGLAGLLVAFGVVLGLGAATAWTNWPPQPGDPCKKFDAYLAPDSGSTGFGSSGGCTGGYPGPLGAQLNTYDKGGPFEPVVDRPWLVFPLGGALVCGVLALSLGYRDFRITRRKV